jgi:hypothetical protein
MSGRRHVSTAYSRPLTTALSFFGPGIIFAPLFGRVRNVSTRINQETVNDTAKLLMHRLIARSLARNPSLRNRAKSSLAQMARHFPDRTFVAEWEALLRLPVSKLRNVLTRRDQHMKRLRVSSPFVTAEGVNFTDAALRRRIGLAARRIASRSPMLRKNGSLGPGVRSRPLI